MSKRNAFEELQEELEGKFTPEKEESLKSKITGTVGSLTFIAEIIELFVTKLFSVLIGKGANNKEEKQ